MTSLIHLSRGQITAGALNPAGQRAGADSGDPQLRVLQIGMESGGKIGLWECQPGGWPVVNRPDTEFAYILEGRATLTDDATGQKADLQAGDAIILPPGWTGRWDVIEAVRKIYVIY